MVEGDEKLLFLSDIDGEVDQHIERLVESAGPVFDAIFKHVDDPPATPVAENPERVVKWLKHHVREPLDTYFAYEDASVQDIKACARAAGFTGNTRRAPADLHGHQVTPAGLRPEAGRKVHCETMPMKRRILSGRCMSPISVPFEHNHLGFFTIFDGDFEKYIQDFAEKTSFVFDAVFPHVDGAPPTPVAKNAQAFYEWALENNHQPIGFYSAYPGLWVQDIRALLADHASQPATADSTRVTCSRP